MTPLVITAVSLISACLLLTLYFRSNAGVMFLASCAGLVLLNSLDPSVVTTAGSVVPGGGESIVRIIVVALSVVFAALMFRHTVSGNGKLMMHGLIALFMAATLWLILPATTGLSWLLQVQDEAIWQDVNEFRSLIIAVGFSLSLFAIFTDHTRKHARHGKH